MAVGRRDTGWWRGRPAAAGTGARAQPAAGRARGRAPRAPRRRRASPGSAPRAARAASQSQSPRAARAGSSERCRCRALAGAAPPPSSPRRRVALRPGIRAPSPEPPPAWPKGSPLGSAPRRRRQSCHRSAARHCSCWRRGRARRVLSSPARAPEAGRRQNPRSSAF
ncbi:MAG: hypothetical protein J3K34DRAFT_449666 [Monoraphidium minutum]|nr:MAG: hypothetical protein J3K34DRAFT_449666 [Monoraphidium minutum]